MARVLRNFRYRSLKGLFFLENVRYMALLDSILALDEEFYKFPESSVPSLQTLCIKWVVRRSSVLFEPYASCSAEQLLRALPPGPFDGLPPLLCDLLCDLLMSLRQPESAATPLYCVISPYTRRLSLRSPLTEVAAAPLEALLAARVRHLVELTWTGAPVTRRLLDYVTSLPALTTLITDASVGPADVRELLLRCPSLRTLRLRDGGCVATLSQLDAVGDQLRDLRLLEDHEMPLDLAAVSTVFPSLEKLCVQPTSPKGQWRVEAIGFPDAEPWFDDLAAPYFRDAKPWFGDLVELSLEGCENRWVLQRPLKMLSKLALERCHYFLEDLAIQPQIKSVSLVQCITYFRNSPCYNPRLVVNAETLHLKALDRLPDLSLTVSALTFPRVRQLVLDGDACIVSPEAEFDELRELHYSFSSSVLAERVLSILPLSQLENLSLSYQTDDGTPLALEMLSRCSRLVELELEGFSNLSVPRGLKLPAVRRLRLRGSTCRPRVVHWLMKTLPGLQCLQLVELTIESSSWTPWFREWHQAGIEVELEGGCTMLPWRRSGIRRHAPAL